MSRKSAVTIVLLAVLAAASVSAQMRIRRTPARRVPAPATVQAKANLELPPQPEATALAAPDLIVKEIRVDAPAAKLQPNQQWQVHVVVQNIGQWESGVFLVRLSVRKQIPASSTDVVGTGRVQSVQPRKTGVSTGTQTVSFNYTTGNHAWAQYTFTAVADCTGHIREFDEANNELVSTDYVVDTLRD
jgi:hypothetical protein